MPTLAPGISYCDLQFRGRARAVAAVTLGGTDGIALIDPGPTSTLPALRAHLAEQGAAIRDVTAILLTHIHLDHAGATGTLARENPRLRVYVHERGAPHMAAPDRLLASATRLYGDEMDTLWGEFAPVPVDRMVPLSGGEHLLAGGAELRVAYTPGHAVHHVSFFNAKTGVAFVGDTAGIRIVPRGFVLPPTPPPDIDLERWRESLTTIESWSPEILMLTHFGPSSDVAAHLAEMRAHLGTVGALGRQSLQIDGDERRREEWFTEQLRRELRGRLNEADAAAYEISGRFDLNWRGLARYWQKQAAGTAGA